MGCRCIQLGINNFGISISRDVQGNEDIKRRWSSVECRYRWHHKKQRKLLEHKVTIEVRILIDMCCESQVMYPRCSGIIK
ncbi:hypothetical protein GQ457_17G015340 [Hibiscus cannabinus]